MKKFFYLSALVFTVQQTIAQVPEDAIRMSWNAPSGTARNQAIGGAMGSLGGEITSLYVNPAGLAFYKTGEVVLSPGLSMLRGKGNYRGTDSKTGKDTEFNLGTSGIVWGYNNRFSKWQNKAVSFGINRTANFNGRTLYGGENNYSSFSESFAEEFAQSGLPIDVTLYTAPLSLGTKLANYTYLIDTADINGNTEVVGLPLRNAILGNTEANLLQAKDIRTKGGITELAFGYAANMDDKVYIGGSVGIPIVNYERTSTMTEVDLSGDNNNNFNYANYTEEYTSKGVGINARLGIIVRPVQQVRAGFSIQSPTLYGLKEKTTGRIEAGLENYLKTPISVATADSIYTQFGAAIPEYRYDLVSPWKFLISGSYVINEIQDVSRQRGFITADVEYVTYRSSRFNSADPEDNSDYYQGINDAVKLSYKGAVNVRVGGEMKFNTIMTRLGFAYYGNPYNDDNLKAHIMNLSGGLGYRNKGIFVDLTYVHSIKKDVNFPYRLSDKDNVYADVKNRAGNVIMTVGFKF